MFLVKTINITFIYLLALFIVQSFKKILREDPGEDVPLLDPKWSICPKQDFFWKKIISSTHWPLSWCKILKKFLQLIQSYEDAPFVLDPKWPIFPDKNFSGNPLIKVQKPFVWVIWTIFGYFCLLRILNHCRSYEFGFVCPSVMSIFFSDNRSKDFSDFVYDYGSLWVGWNDSPFSG